MQPSAPGLTAQSVEVSLPPGVVAVVDVVDVVEVPLEPVEPVPEVDPAPDDVVEVPPDVDSEVDPDEEALAEDELDALTTAPEVETANQTPPTPSPFAWPDFVSPV
jgi:hypothetical protein